MKKLSHLYRTHRLIHINVNAVIAGIISILLSIPLVHLTTFITHNKFLIALLAYGIDGAIDSAIFATLHLILYSRGLRKFNLAKTLGKDLLLLQTHRTILALGTLSISFVLHLILLYFGMGRSLSFIIAYSVGLISTRIIHSIYGLRTGLFKPISL